MTDIYPRDIFGKPNSIKVNKCIKKLFKDHTILGKNIVYDLNALEYDPQEIKKLDTLDFEK